MENITKRTVVFLSDNNKRTIFLIIYILSLLCIISAPFVTSFLIIAALGLFVFSLVLLPKTYSYSLLFGLFPFANIFKLSPGTMSFLTICEILLASIILLEIIANYKTAKCDALALFAVAFMTLYLLIFSSKVEYLSIIKLIVRIFLVAYYLKSDMGKNDGLPAKKRTAYCLSASMLLMMILSQIDFYRDAVTPYLRIVQLNPTNSDIIRSGGLLDDPNYCALAIMVTLAFMTVFYYYKIINFEYWLLSVPLFLIGFTTYSKSYFLTAIVFLIVLLLLVLLPKNKFLAIVLCVIIAIVGFAIFNGQIKIINQILARFDMFDLTTGRDELNKQYLSYIFNNPKILFFGEGFDAINLPGVNNVHNLYIEILFRLGIIGSLLFAITIIICFSKTHSKSKWINYIPAFFVATMYMALAGLDSYELFYYILLAGICILQIRDIGENRKISEEISCNEKI